MTGGPHFDIDAILGEEPAGDPDHRARLVAGLSATLDRKISTVRRYRAARRLSRSGLTEEEKLSLYRNSGIGCGGPTWVRIRLLKPSENPTASSQR
jgi:hypothetical protein